MLFYYLVPQNQPALGASGAIFGLFGAWFVVSRRLNLDSRGIVMLIAINLALSFIYRSTIAWQDHVGGLITGAVITAAYVYAPRKSQAALTVFRHAALLPLSPWPRSEILEARATAEAGQSLRCYLFAARA